MDDTGPKASFIQRVPGEAREIQSHLVHVACLAIRCQDYDGLANSIGDRAKVLLTLSQRLLGALALCDVTIDYVLGNLASHNRDVCADNRYMNAGAVFASPHRFDVQTLASKSTTRVFLRLNHEFF